MPYNYTTMKFVVCYDVADDKKRTALSRILEGWGTRVQFSAFEIKVTVGKMDELSKSIEELLDPDEDRCHIYRLCADCAQQRKTIGKDLEAQVEGCIVC